MARMGDDKARDLAGLHRVRVKFPTLRHQRDGIPLREKAGQVHLGVGDPRLKAELVNLPQAMEVSRAILAQDELLVNCWALPRRLAQWVRHFAISLLERCRHSIAVCWAEPDRGPRHS